MATQEILVLTYMKDGSLEPSGLELLNPALYEFTFLCVDWHD